MAPAEEPATAAAGESPRVQAAQQATLDPGGEDNP